MYLVLHHRQQHGQHWRPRNARRGLQARLSEVALGCPLLPAVRCQVAAAAAKLLPAARHLHFRNRATGRNKWFGGHPRCMCTFTQSCVSAPLMHARERDLASHDTHVCVFPRASVCVCVCVCLFCACGHHFDLHTPHLCHL